MRRPSMVAPRQWGKLRRAVGVWLVLTLALGTVAVPEAWAADYYVDTAGSDAADGSQATPWKTLTHALGQVTSGDAVHLAAGTYDTPGNGETFPLALVDGVTILGDTANPAGVVISAPVGSQVFFNDDTNLSASTRLAGVTLQHDASTSEPLVEFAVDAAVMEPQIDHDVFAGTSNNDDGISSSDDGSSAGTFTPTIDGNTFTSLDEAIILTNVQQGVGQVFSPVITNNTFTGCDYPVNYTMSSSPEGTVGGLVEGNTFTGTGSSDVYVYFSPESGGTGLLFNPTITGNDMQSGASTNVYGGLYGSSYSGDATFAPTITNNTMDAQDYNVKLSGHYYYMDGDYTVAPTISGNTMTGASSPAVSLYLTTFSVSTSAQRNVIAPTITNNTITPSGGDGVMISLSDWSNGQIEGTATIAGNTITGADYGVQWEMDYMYGGDGMDWTIVISNNTITSPVSDGISFSMESMSFSGTGVFNLTMEGNTISGAGYHGIGAYPAYSWYSDNQVAETVLIRGNTVTGSDHDGIYLYFSDQTSNTLDARITDNVLQNNGDDGLDLESNDLGSNGILVACNLITGNTDNGIEQGNGYDPPADYGGGNLGSPGGNVLMNNSGFDFQNEDTDQVRAESNWWGSTDAATIDGNIRDDDEGAYGAVDFDPFLTSEPSVVVDAPLTASVVNDVPPAGPSVGDTLEYTAVLATGGCGDASVQFSAPIDPNTTVVAGSVTTTQGIVQSEDPPEVAVGVIPSGTQVTITWQVLVDGGTSVQTQGTITATRSGTTLTDDPGQPGTSDPTVTVLVVPQAGTVQFDPAAYSVNESDGTVTLTVTRAGGSDGAVTVNYTTADGTAAAPGDYITASGSLSWADGDASAKQIAVSIVDDGTAEGDESFTVELSDPPGSSFVGSPATATVTIHDDDQANPIPTLDQWGMILFAGLILLLGAGLIRRKHWTGAAMVMLLAVSLAVPAGARGRRTEALDLHASSVRRVEVSGGQAMLQLADGTTLTVPESRLLVRKGRAKSAKDVQGRRMSAGQRQAQAARRRAERASRPRLSQQQRRALAAERKAGGSRAARMATLKPGTPVFVILKLDKKDGTVRRVKVWTFDTPEQAQAELERRNARRKHPRQ